MLKKIWAVALGSLLVMSLAACGKKGTEPAQKTEEAAEKENTQKPEEDSDKDKLLIGVDCLQDDAFDQQLYQTIQNGCEERGWECMVTFNNQDNITTLSNIDSFITKGVDCILVYLTDLGCQQSVQEKCDAAGIPVIFIGVEAEGYILIQSNDLDAGEEMGYNVAMGAKDKWPDIETVDLVITYGDTQLGQLNTDRLEGMINGVRKVYDVPEEKYIVLDGERDQLAVTEAVSAVLTANPGAEHIIYLGIHTMWDMGAYNAFEAAGRLEQLAMGSWHCYSEAIVEAIKNEGDTFIGSMDLPGDQYALTAMEIMDQLAAGEEAEARVYRTGWVWLEGSNIDEYYQF